MYSFGFLAFCVIAIVVHHFARIIYDRFRLKIADLIAYFYLTIAIILAGAQQ
jgi:hypothetical protein